MKISKHAVEVLNIVANYGIEDIPGDVIERLDPCEIAEIVSADLTGIDKNLIYELRLAEVDDDIIMAIISDSMIDSKFTDVYINRAIAYPHDASALRSISHFIQRLNMDEEIFHEVSVILNDEGLTNTTCADMMRLVGTGIAYTHDEFYMAQKQPVNYATYELMKKKLINRIISKGGTDISELAFLMETTYDAMSVCLREYKWNKVHTLLETIYSDRKDQYMINTILKTISNHPDRIDEIIAICYKYKDSADLKNIDLWIDSGVSIEKIVGLRRGEIEDHIRNKHVVEELFNYVLNN